MEITAVRMFCAPLRSVCFIFASAGGLLEIIASVKVVFPKRLQAVVDNGGAKIGRCSESLCRPLASEGGKCHGGYMSMACGGAPKKRS